MPWWAVADISTVQSSCSSEITNGDDYNPQTIIRDQRNGHSSRSSANLFFSPSPVHPQAPVPTINEEEKFLHVSDLSSSGGQTLLIHTLQEPFFPHMKPLTWPSGMAAGQLGQQ